ncbi:MAG TPA: prephenate dehydrogenase/arogenate dehydrogenase family protein [Mycobacteriales bacterium]|nr:prephenate dehydrogenase/arogenate dehydrogenase family protein [Mycobacteriales bacterium]
MRIAVMGLGLIGGSVARRLAPDHDVRVWDTDAATRDLAAARGLTVAEDPAADLVVLATPMDALPAVLSGLSPGDGPIVTDVGSVKVPVLAAARAAGLAGRYVGGHPMTGLEQSGFEASDPGLLDDAVWVLTLEEDTDLDRWLTVAGVVTAAGCRVLPATAADHDEAQARISGLPHLLASALAVAGANGGPLAGAIAAGSFRDGTRVAGTRAEFVAALCDGNREALARVLDETLAELSAARDALAGGGSVRPLAEAGNRAARALSPSAGTAVSLDRTTPDLRERLLALGTAGGTVDAVTEREIRGQVSRGAGAGKLPL